MLLSPTRCAFVKLPSMKESKRVITEMKGFPYKLGPMEIRFTAAADFEDFTVTSKCEAEISKDRYLRLFQNQNLFCETRPLDTIHLTLPS